MSTSPDSIRERLLIVAKEKKLAFQDLLNRYGAEQFLSRLSSSPFLEQFIFKGGSLLTYLIETDRQTRDLDFTIRRISNRVEEALEVIQKILNIKMDDGLTWHTPDGAPLNHPGMDYPGVRIKCLFALGKARGLVRMDLALGDVVKPRKISLQRIQYRGKPLIGVDFHVLAYPPESIFAEKLQIAIKRGEQNTRMKDYYDLYKLVKSAKLNPSILKQCIDKTFEKRTTDLNSTFWLGEDAFEKLQIIWSAYIKKIKIGDAPKELREIVNMVNQQLKAIYNDE